MLWYKNLYISKKAEAKRATIIQKIRSGNPPFSAYVILPASNRKNLLDIYPASGLIKGEEFLILGIAWGYWDALRLAGQMVDEVYHATGGFDFWRYLGLAVYGAEPENTGTADDSDVVE